MTARELCVRYWGAHLWSPNMIASKLSVVALCFCLPLMASPALARHRSKEGHEAGAQAFQPFWSEGVTPHRADALRECSVESGKLLQKDWGVRQTTNYGACMMNHGEIE